MTAVIEGLIQLLGCVLLQMATLGRYGRVRPGDPVLLEGSVGLGAVALALFVSYRVIS